MIMEAELETLYYARQLEVSLYRFARSLEAYKDVSTLKARLQLVASNYYNISANDIIVADTDISVDDIIRRYH